MFPARHHEADDAAQVGGIGEAQGGIAERGGAGDQCLGRDSTVAKRVRRMRPQFSNHESHSPLDP